MARERDRALSARKQATVPGSSTRSFCFVFLVSLVVNLVLRSWFLVSLVVLVVNLVLRSWFLVLGVLVVRLALGVLEGSTSVSGSPPVSLAAFRLLSYNQLMVRDCRELREFEDDLLRRTPVDIAQNFRIIDALWEEAIQLGVVPTDNPLEGIETDIRIARVINSVRPTS